MLIALLIGLVIGIGTGWLLHHQQAYASLRWWESHRINQLHEQAEQLRNGPLQDLFGLRRHLELLLSSENLTEVATGPQLLSQLQRASQQLEQCSDRLSSPFDLATDSASLPLALQTVLQSQQNSGQPRQPGGETPRDTPLVQVKLNLPQQWERGPSLGSLLLPTFVEQLTQIYWQSQPRHTGDRDHGEEHGGASPEIHAQLLPQPNQAQFCLQLRPPPDPTSLSPEDAAQLRQAFQKLSGGRCQVNRSDEVETWRFTWS